MLDDSINESPHKEHHSIHKRRQQRKLNLRRREATKNLLNATNESVVEQTRNSFIQDTATKPTLAALYAVGDSDDDGDVIPGAPSLNTTFRVKYGSAFDPYEDELLLAVAERLERAQLVPKSSVLLNMQQGQGFSKCSQLFNSDAATDAATSIVNVTKTATVATNTQHFGITESELLHCCVEAEERLSVAAADNVPSTSNNIAIVTPHRTIHRAKTIVESILEDFGVSPQSPCSPPMSRPPENDATTTTPVFRFKDQPIRTYSCRRRLNALPALSEVVDTASNCSSDLSMQEGDVTQLPAASHVELNDSRAVCNNLLNLSAYFTQLSAAASQPSNSSQDDVNAFLLTAPSNDDDPDSATAFKTSSLIARLTDEIIAIRAKYIYQWPPLCSGAENFCGFSSAVEGVECEDLNVAESADTQQLVPYTAYVSEAVQNCEEPILAEDLRNDDNVEESLHKTPPSKQEVAIFSDNDDDCEFFRNFKTQDVLPVFKEPSQQPVSSFQGFKCASGKGVNISKAAQERAARILADIDVETVAQHATAQQNCGTKLNDLNTKIVALNNTKLLSDTETNTVPLQGFQTASKKTIRISAQAQKRAQSILQELPELPMEKENVAAPNLEIAFKKPLHLVEQHKEPVTVHVSAAVDVEFLADIQLSEWLLEEAPASPPTIKQHVATEPTSCQGFQTASNKGISISAAAMQRARGLLEELPELQLDMKAAVVKDPIVGFRTASKKCINISTAAQKRAAAILQSLPELPKSTKTADEKFEKIECADSAFKRKFDAITTPSTSVEPAAKILCRSYTAEAMQTTPLRAPPTLGASRSAFAGVGALSAEIKSRLITRKNLLTLSKRKKIKTQELQVPLIESSSNSADATPVRKTADMTPDTPNMRAFCAAQPLTSTPRPLSVPAEKTPHTSRNGISIDIDADFQHITWDESNESSSLNTHSKSTNVSAAPSPQQRIQRLRMYGRPPQISPLLMASKNNCRPSGLRRSDRSMKGPNN